MDVPSLNHGSRTYNQTANHTTPHMFRTYDITTIDDLASNGMILYHSADSV